MVLQALVTLAVEAAEEEPSKTAFYVLGGLLAVYAVAISFVGLRGSTSFPGSTGARNGVIALTTVLVLATMAGTILTS
jgi:hypothetical protein